MCVCETKRYFSFFNSANEPLIKLERRQLKNNGEFIKLHVSLVSSPLSFVIQLEEDLKQLNEMMGDFQKHCSSSAKFTSLNDLQKGECYAVLDDDSRKWVRWVKRICLFATMLLIHFNLQRICWEHSRQELHSLPLHWFRKLQDYVLGQNAYVAKQIQNSTKACIEGPAQW